jgi:ABC-type transporter Mla MlaB component
MTRARQERRIQVACTSRVPPDADVIPQEARLHTHTAFAVRPGEHACCRFASAEDRRSLTIALVRDAVRRNYKVVYLCPNDDPDGAIAALARLDYTVTQALARGQMEVRTAQRTYLPDGAFDAERMLECLRGDNERAVSEGWAGLSINGDMSWALAKPDGHEALGEYEQRLNDVIPGPAPVLVCQYDHSRGRHGSVSELVGVHDVDLSPELAPLARHDHLGAARIMPEGALRLVGELDFACAPALTEVLGHHFHGPLKLDLADLTYVDVTGMRALRGRKGQRLTILAASEPVLRLAELLAWDTDPGVDVPA